MRERSRPLAVGHGCSLLQFRLKWWCRPRGPIDSAGELVDPLQLPIDSAGELEGIGCLKRLLQHGHLLGICRLALQHPLKGRAGRVIATSQTRAYADLALQLHRGPEQILEDPKLFISFLTWVQFFCSMWALSSFL